MQEYPRQVAEERRERLGVAQRQVLHAAFSIGPGYILTDMNEALVNNPSVDAWVKSSNPAQRWGKPEELVGTAVFLASAASNYINGQIIYVDGGWLSVL